MGTAGRRAMLALAVVGLLAAGAAGTAVHPGSRDAAARATEAAVAEAGDAPSAVLTASPVRRGLSFLAPLALVAVAAAVAPRRWTRRVHAPATAPSWTLVRPASWASRAPPAVPPAR